MTSAHDVRACLPLADGRVLAGTAGGLVLTDAQLQATERLTALAGLPGTRVHVVAMVSGQPARFWIGTEGGLARLFVANGPGGAQVEKTWPSRPVRALLDTPDGLLVATWGGGLFRLKNDQLTTVAASKANMTSLALHDGSVVIGTAGQGALRLIGSELSPVAGISETSYVWALRSTPTGLDVGTLIGRLHIARDGATKVVSTRDVRAFSHKLEATFGEGVTGGPADVRFAHAVRTAHGATCVGARSGLWLRRANGPWKSAALSGPPSNDIAALAYDGRRLWVGTFDKGLAVLEGGRWTRVTDPALDDRINGLAIADGSAWAATARGLVRVTASAKGFEVTRFTTADGLKSNDVHCVTALLGGGVLAGTGKGAVVVKGQVVRPIWRKQGLWIRSVWAVAQDKRGRIYLGTARGLYRGKLGNRGWRRFSMATGHLADDWVTALHIDSDRVYVGTYSGGVSEIHRYKGVQLGGGWVNFAGLAKHGSTLLAATMDGLMERGSHGQWNRVPGAAAGKDVTQLARTPDGLYVASRRGLTFLPHTD